MMHFVHTCLLLLVLEGDCMNNQATVCIFMCVNLMYVDIRLQSNKV